MTTVDQSATTTVFGLQLAGLIESAMGIANPAQRATALKYAIGQLDHARRNAIAESKGEPGVTTVLSMPGPDSWNSES